MGLLGLAFGVAAGAARDRRLYRGRAAIARPRPVGSGARLLGPLLEGLVERIKKEMGRQVTVIATGGLATLFDEHTKVFDAIEPDLTIQGLGLLYDMAVRGSK